MESWAIRVVHERARVHGAREDDEDGVDQVKQEDDGKLKYAARAVGARKT